MSLLIDVTAKVCFIVLFALAAVALLRHRSAALRHWLLAAAILGAALAPMLRPIAPAWSLPLNSASPASQPAASSHAGAVRVREVAQLPLAQRALSHETPRHVDRLLALAWAGGTVVGLLVLLAGVFRLSRIASRAERLADGRSVRIAQELCRSAGLTGRVAILESDHPSLPATWGFVHPKIVLPASAREWSDERLRIVLLHELVHIQRADWLTQLAADCVRAVYWFNPLLWIVSRRLRQESEYACDDAVLCGGVDGAEYASHLLALARAATARHRALLEGFTAPAMARPSSLERRFSAMLNCRLNRSPLTRRARLVTTITAVMVAVLVAGFGAQTFSTFSGSVLDSTNRIVPGLTIKLVNVRNQAKYEVTSDGTGRFEFVGLPPGEYAWETALAGFAKTNGTISVAGKAIQHDITLRVGSLEETVTIRGGGPAASGATLTPGNDVDARRQEKTINVDEARRRRNAKPCEAGAIGGTISAPTKLKDVAPLYPQELSAANVTGVVILELVVDTNGDVRDVSVLRSPHPGLEQAAIDAVRQWRYTSTMLNCVPVEFQMMVSANFVNQP